MNYIYELIKEKKPDIPKEAVEYVVSFMLKEGFMSYTVQYHYDIYDFYIKLADHYETLNLDKKCAIIDTMQHFKISRGFLYKIINRFAKKGDLLQA